VTGVLIGLPPWYGSPPRRVRVTLPTPSYPILSFSNEIGLNLLWVTVAWAWLLGPGCMDCLAAKRLRWRLRGQRQLLASPVDHERHCGCPVGTVSGACLCVSVNAGRQDCQQPTRTEAYGDRGHTLQSQPGLSPFAVCTVDVRGDDSPRPTQGWVFAGVSVPTIRTDSADTHMPACLPPLLLLCMLRSWSWGPLWFCKPLTCSTPRRRYCSLRRPCPVAGPSLVLQVGLDSGWYPRYVVLVYLGLPVCRCPLVSKCPESSCM
jgi:hypothetical protein